MGGTGYNINFTDTSKETIKAMQVLSKKALNASGKVVRKIIRDKVPERTKLLKNHIASWAFVNKATGQPTIQIGFYGWQKVRQRGKQPSHANPHWIEFGTKPHKITVKSAKAMGYGDNFFGGGVNHPGAKPQHVLRNAVYDNISEIKAAQTEFLAEITKITDPPKEENEVPEDDI
ncbi:MAG: hypothetical protein FWF15_05545 [Oscillospiraceae bacterium]|nr:hypothetical protein [Oscillospiraceae bacterium]